MPAGAGGRDRADADERRTRLLRLTGQEEPSPGWLVGTVDEVASQLEELRAVGVSRVFLQHLDHRDLDAIAVMAELRG
jgi:hypothetical protein